YQSLFPRTVNRFPVVIIDIDDASLTAFGRWPWPRSRLAKLAEATHKLGVKAIGFDLIMPEPDDFTLDTILGDRDDASSLVREELAKLPSNDEILAETLRKTPSVIARAAVIESGQEGITAHRQTSVMVIGDSPVPYAVSYNGHLANIPLLENAAFGCGYLNDTRDEDGVIRSTPLVLTVNKQLAPAFSIELLRTAIGAKWYAIHVSKKGIKGVQLGESFIPTDTDGRIRIYFSPAYEERRISALSVLNGDIPAGSLPNSLAIIGVTGVGAMDADVKPTPITSRMDGVEIHAQVVENILENSRLIRPQYAIWMELGIFLLSGILLIILLPRLNPGYGVAAFLLLTLLLFSTAIFIFAETRVLYDPSFPVFGNIIILIVLLTAGFSASNRRRRELNAALETERLERVRLSGELGAAREIQLGMVPDTASIQGLPSHLQIAAILEPAYEVGGDFYDAFMIDDRHLFFSVGDVSGKGVDAALFMALCKTLCKSIALRGYIPLKDLIRVVNREASQEDKAMLFVTMIAGIIDVVTGELQLCRAGHEAPVLLNQNAPARQIILEGGPPLCVLEDYEYQTTGLKLQSGDILVLISDGITEAQNAGKELYGGKRIIDYLKSLDKEKHYARMVCRGLYEDVKRFTGDAGQSDDISIMALKFDHQH
ncbi:MAG: CHASE2 domain-containing protein, partial [Deltaproteobacteria bacterium]|nr:CHASE2 domain-containing protein [Deltaproteobacteria bacterium]